MPIAMLDHHHFKETGMGHSLLGGLLVIWLLGAPVVWALASLINTPSASTSP